MRTDTLLSAFLRGLGQQKGDSVHIEKRPSKYDRRYKYIVVLDDDQILREFWPPSKENEELAKAFMDGYRMAKVVWYEG